MLPAARPFWALVLGAAAAVPAFAQTSSSSSPSPSSHPAASAAEAELGYHSTLADYQRFSEQPVGSWREANDNVGRIGGWRAYAREAREPAAPAPSGAAASSPGPAADPHAGNGKP